MCLAIPGEIKQFCEDEPSLALVEVSGVSRRVNIDLLKDDNLALGDWVLIHVGFAMSRMSAEEANEQIRLLEMMGEGELALEELKGYRIE